MVSNNFNCLTDKHKPLHVFLLKCQYLEAQHFAALNRQKVQQYILINVLIHGYLVITISSEVTLISLTARQMFAIYEEKGKSNMRGKQGSHHILCCLAITIFMLIEPMKI